MSVQVKVSFPHKDWQGNPHDVGEVYACSEQEADTRVRDGFVRRVEGYSKPAAKAESKPAKTEQSRKAAEDKAPSA
jgi:1,2-phenylacetyl-CoA epoxidase PaaB subunit